MLFFENFFLPISSWFNVLKTFVFFIDKIYCWFFVSHPVRRTYIWSTTISKKKKLLKNLLLRFSVLTRKVPGKQKNFQKLSNREIYIILQSKSTTYTKPFMPISWSNFIEEHHKFSSDIWDKIFTNWFTKCSDG